MVRMSLLGVMAGDTQSSPHHGDIFLAPVDLLIQMYYAIKHRHYTLIFYRVCPGESNILPKCPIKIINCKTCNCPTKYVLFFLLFLFFFLQGVGGIHEITLLY